MSKCAMAYWEVCHDVHRRCDKCYNAISNCYWRVGESRHTGDLDLLCCECASSYAHLISHYAKVIVYGKDGILYNQHAIDRYTSWFGDIILTDGPPRLIKN